MAHLAQGLAQVDVDVQLLPHFPLQPLFRGFTLPQFSGS